MLEIRDVVYGFIHFDEDEKKLINSRPFQRLRFIKQLSLTHLLYPGATHTRFEHSIGVMEMATRLFDTIFRDHSTKQRFGLTDSQASYWRKVVRLAALCHDLGHLPFSHTGENLLPQGFNHERITHDIICDAEVSKLLSEITPCIRTADVAKIAIGPKEYLGKDQEDRFSDLERVLSEIIGGDIFGADRIDYLLRDSHHLGVAYGKFDYQRLVGTVRILSFDRDEEETIPQIGIEHGGIHTAEALLLARYYMYTQVYFHSTRRAYNKHLIAFIKKWLEGQDKKYLPVDPQEHLKLTDDVIMGDMYRAAQDKESPCHDLAERIVYRKHFKKIDQSKVLEDKDEFHGRCQALCRLIGEENVIEDYSEPELNPYEFPVLVEESGKVEASSDYSALFRNPLLFTPIAQYLFVHPDRYGEAIQFLKTYAKG